MKSFSGVTFVCFASFLSLCFRYSRRPSFNCPSIYRRPDSHKPFFLFFLLFIWICRFSRVFFVPFPLSRCMESTSYALSFPMVFFYLVSTGWIFDISLYENSIKKNNQCMQCLKKNQTTPRLAEHPPVMGGKMSKRLGGIKRLQIQNLFMAFIIVIATGADNSKKSLRSVR